jgi:hypothetical protein
MDVIGYFICITSSSTVQVADVQKLVSVVKMMSVFEKCTTEDQRSVNMYFFL